MRSLGQIYVLVAYAGCRNYVMANILYIIQYLALGGTETQLVQLIRGLEGGSRFSPHLCTLMPSGGGFFEELAIPKIELQFRSFLHLSVLSRSARLSTFIRRHEIHIVQTFFQDPFLLAAIVRPLHTFRLIGAFRDLGFWRTPAAIRKMRSAYPFFDGFIANSQAVKEYFVREDRIRPDKITVIHNGIDVDKEVPTPAGHSPLVGIVANCNRAVKRVQDFVYAAALVHRNRPGTRFMVVGDGPLRPELEELSRSLGLGEAIRFTGQIERPLYLIRDFMVGVITSETEGFCNAILEYMACGVPTVATATGGNPELVCDGEHGFLVPVGDVKQMAEKIELLLEDAALRARMRGANLARVARDFSISQMVAGHESYYDRILGI